MIIDLKKINKKDIERLILDKRMNISAAQDLFDYCFESAKKAQKQDVSSLAEYLNLNLNDKEDNLYFSSRIKPAIKEIDNQEYDNNYYRKNILPKEYKGEGYHLTYLTIKPYQCLPYDDVEISDDFVEVSRIGYFTKPFKYLAVLKDDVVWMSTDPNEINTMKEAIEEANGRVLAFGLGLGYFPLMVALKEEVKEVTIVEYDQKIIDIFNTHILPLFEKKEKIHVVKGDAFDFAKRDLRNDYDYLFVDIWHNPEDGLPMYLKLYKDLKKQSIKTFYWLEKSILAMLRRCLLTVIEENLLGYKEKDYQKAENEYDQIVNDLFFKTKNITFHSINEIKEILQDNQLRKLI